jgi:hypothetical protein
MAELDTPWTRARKLKSQNQEERLDRTEGGKKGVNSGRFWRWKRDGMIREFLVEARTTDAGSYRIEKAEFEQIMREGLHEAGGALAAMQIDIQDLHLIVIRLSEFESMYTRLIELETRLEQVETPD